MKLQTTILPRKSGQVIARGADGSQYVFAPDHSGDLVCDVEDQATVAMLIKTGNFHPADPAEYEVGIAVAQQFYPETAEVDEPLDDDHENLNAMPIEDETPPSRRKPRKAK